MSPLAEQALANARARLLVGWPLLIVALALYAPADTLTRLVLLLVGAALAVGKVPATPAGKVRKQFSSTKFASHSTASVKVPPQRKGGGSE